MRAAVTAIPLFLFAGDALAWGLQTHLFFAQHVLLALPLIDPEIRRAALRLPRLVLAGACLPDLSLAGRVLGTTVFRRTHDWSALRRYAAAASDEERAIALGYASHLLADVVAHNQFVPEHESRIGDVAWVTHAMSEWAMDHQLRGAVFGEVSEILEAERSVLVAVVARRMCCEERLVRRALELVARGDRLLRRSRIPWLCGVLVQRFDSVMEERFEAYARATLARLAGTGAALEGVMPRAAAEPD